MDLRFLHKGKQRITYLLENVPVDPSGSLELQSHWARYTCVVMSGFLEDSIKIVLSRYAEERSPRTVADYVSAQLYFFQNANTDEIGRLLKKFSAEWNKEFQAFLSEERKAAVNSIVGNRHRVAHGQDCVVTIGQLKAWYPMASDVVDLIVKFTQAEIVN
jgi:hypothetical protein